MENTNMPFPNLAEIHFSAVRSRGPGGQNVNKVSSAAQLNWEFMLSPSLSEEQKNRIHEKLYNYINRQGILYLRSDEFRDLERNKARCLEKLEKLLKRAFHIPKRRKKTRPTKASKQKRIDTKKQRGEVKQTRKKVNL